MLPVEIIDKILKFDNIYFYRRSCEQWIVRLSKKYNDLITLLDSYGEKNHGITFVSFVRKHSTYELFHRVISISPSFGNFSEKRHMFTMEDAKSKERYREYKIMMDVKDYFRHNFKTKVAKTKMLKQLKQTIRIN